MSDSPVYWSQPNQQVVRNGEPVAIIPDGGDPMLRETKPTGKHKPEPAPAPELESETAKTSKTSSTKSDS